MQIIADILLFIYVLCILLISLYCCVQLYLLFWYLKSHKNPSEIPTTIPYEKLPKISIQLPIFNEQYVAERLINTIVKLNYPREKLQIQVLDDSTDNTLEITKLLVHQYKNQGFNISLLHRTDRLGYKAGALKRGMEETDAEFIAIFDADFLPKEDFLISCIPYFQDPSTAVVQTRWEHINQNYSWLTKLQAIQLNVHFTVEQVGRMQSQNLLQFNGTAGIWRKQAIIDAGGWQIDTLTEDLDLSIRAQLKSWKIKYLESLGAPSELPVEMNGLKSQQFRWMKGGAECAKKLLPIVWKSDLSFSKKMHTSFHLLSSTVFLLIFISSILTVPILFFINYYDTSFKWLGLFLISWVMIIMVYFAANFNKYVKEKSSFWDYIYFLLKFPLFLSLSMGLSLHNSIAVWQGFSGKKSAFIRTPKYNIKSKDDLFQKTSYLSTKMPLSTKLEFIVAFYFIGGIYLGFLFHNYVYMIIHFMLVFGFLSIASYSWKQTSKES